MWKTVDQTQVLSWAYPASCNHLLSLFSEWTRRFRSFRPCKFTRKLPSDMSTENGSWMGPRR